MTDTNQGSAKQDEKYQNDLKILEKLIENREDNINNFYLLVDDKEINKSIINTEDILNDALAKLGLGNSKKEKMAIALRFASLREQELRALVNEDREKMELAYKLVREYYEFLDNYLIQNIDALQLFSDFERTLFHLGRDMAVQFNDLTPRWIDLLVHKQEEAFTKRYGEDALKEAGKFVDKDNGEPSEVSYSCISEDDLATIRDGGDTSKIKLKSYVEEFSQFGKILELLDVAISHLKGLDFSYIDAKSYIIYLESLSDAIAYTGKERIAAWRDVDIAYMDAQDEIQFGHMMEYYEDIYRHGIAPEWDMRLKINNMGLELKEGMKEFFINYANELGAKDSMKKAVLKALDNVNVFNSMPIIVAGSLLNGLFSAQVIPNDEVATNLKGKKIFSYTKRIYSSLVLKNTLKADYILLGADGIKDKREVLKSEELYSSVYNIETNGHEFGHILFLEEDSKAKMNVSNELKNIEEFKATMGGLVSYYENTKILYKEELEPFDIYVIKDAIYRAINMLGVKGENDLLPYFCEVLMHLDIMFDTGALTFKDNEVAIHTDKFKDFIAKSIKVYKELATTYINKEDAKDFLYRYVKRDRNTVIPLNATTNALLEYYLGLKKKYGSEVV